MKNLIVNGDDFGLSPETNAGILQCRDQGILTSASLMVGAPACKAAAVAARERPGLDVGLHLVVCMGRSVLAARELAPLVDAAGDFSGSAVGAGMRYFFDRRLRGALERECRAQIERHLEVMGYLNHIDGHLNFQMHPVVLEIVAGLAVEYGVPCVRLTREPLRTTLALSRANLGRKLVEAVIFRSLSRHARSRLVRAGIKSNDWLFGLHQSGNANQHYFAGVMAKLPDDCTTEIYFHPAAFAGGVTPAPWALREVELLTRPGLRDELARGDIRLTTYAELAATGAAAAVAG